MCYGLLGIKLPKEASIIGFSGDTVIVSGIDDVDILEIRLNERLRGVKWCLDSRYLDTSMKKTEAVLESLGARGKSIYWKNKEYISGGK